MDYIPVVDISKIAGTEEISDEDLAATAKEIFAALSGIGFAYLTNHGVPQEIVDKAFKVSKEFFLLPTEIKEKSMKDISKSFHGYARPGQEILARTNDDDYKAMKYPHEFRESYDFCAGFRHFPEDCPEFAPALTELENACRPLAKNLMRLLAISLGVEKDFFVNRSKCLDDPNVYSHTSYRSLYYPPLPDNIEPGTIRLAEHTDYGILSLLFQDDIGGLEVKSVTGKWVQATPMPGTIMLNTGDLLEFWSGGKFPATPHRVLIPEAEIKKKTHRQCIGFFSHPDDTTPVTPLVGVVGKNYTPVIAKDHAYRKLKAAHVY